MALIKHLACNCNYSEEGLPKGKVTGCVKAPPKCASLWYLGSSRGAAGVHDDGGVVGRGRDGGHAVAHRLARLDHAAEGQDLDVREEALRLR